MQAILWKDLLNAKEELRTELKKNPEKYLEREIEYFNNLIKKLNYYNISFSGSKYDGQRKGIRSTAGKKRAFFLGKIF